jgi:hypothetical protein
VARLTCLLELVCHAYTDDEQSATDMKQTMSDFTSLGMAIEALFTHQDWSASVVL